MNNYTYEQRKMIAEYLEDSIEVMNCDHDRLVLRQKIEKLKTVTFGDIREKTGINFIYPPINEEHPLTILKELKTNRLYVGFFKFGFVYDVNDLDDHQKVEVINDPTN